MIEIDVKVKAWGNSAGVIIPKEIMEKADISTGDEIKMKIEKKNLLEEVWGKLKGVKPRKKLSTDEILKEIDRNWSKYD